MDISAADIAEIQQLAPKLYRWIKISTGIRESNVLVISESGTREISIDLVLLESWIQFQSPYSWWTLSQESFDPMSVEIPSLYDITFFRFHLITWPPVVMDTVEHPHALPISCRWLGWIHTVHAASAFLWRERNAALGVKQCLRAFGALYCVAKPWLPLLIHDAQNAGTSFWEAGMLSASALSFDQRGRAGASRLPVQRPRGCIDFE